MNQVTFRNGTTIPQLGLGTWELTGDECARSVAEAIGMGYRHIDTAFAYGNHAEVAQGIRDSGVARDELFVTTKVPLSKLSRSQVLQHGSEIPKQLGMDYVDLLLIHWPNSKVPFEETLGAMGELVQRGLVRNVGISNFNAELVRKADAVSPVPVVTNQVEFHPYLYQRELLETCESLDIRITAFSPIARGQIVGDERLRAIGESHGASDVQVAIAWLMSKQIVVIPKASSREHLASNLAAADLELTPEELRTIDSFGEHRRLVDGPWKHFPLD